MKTEHGKKLKISETIGQVTNEIGKTRKEVKAGKRDRAIYKDILSEGKFLLQLMKTKIAYEKENGRKPVIRMLEQIEM